MADLTFNGVMMACGVQSAIGDINNTIRDLAIDGGGGGLASSDGLVLGRLDSGDAASGITLPNLVRVGDEKAPAGFTPKPTTFLRTGVDGLEIAVTLQGNGADVGAPDADACQPLAGLDALWQGAGLTGASGASPTYVYTPSTSAVYLTIKLWFGDAYLTFQDVLANVTIDLVPGQVGTATFGFEVGSLFAQDTGETWPTGADAPDYTTQASLSAPVVQTPGAGATYTFDTARGFNSYSLSINNNLTRIPDSNQATGERVDLESREITLSSTVWVDSTDPDFDYDELVSTAISTTTGTVLIGTIAASTPAVANAYKIEMENPETTSIKYNELGTNVVVESEQKAVDTVAGSEFTLTFN